MYCSLDIIFSLSILDKIQLRLCVVLTGDLIGLIAEGSCARAAIVADSASVN